MPWQTGQVWVLGGAPKPVAQPQNILVARRELRVHLEPDDRLVRGVAHGAVLSEVWPEARPPRVPVGRALVGVRRAQQRRLVEGAADELQPDGQAPPVKPHGTEIPGRPARLPGA